MKIKILNYNNIKDLEYVIKDEKVNFLFGISGSGKSSIATALTDENTSKHVPYSNSNLEPEVLVNDNTFNRSDFCVFDTNYMTNVLINKNQGSDIYNIILGENGNINELKEDYNDFIQELLGLKEKIYSLKGSISVLINDLKIDYKLDGSYKASCIINKITKNASQEKLNYVKSKKYLSKRISWFSDGINTEEYTNGKCPFCNRKLTDSKKEIVEKIIVFDAKSFEKINSKSGIFSDLNLTVPDWIKKKEVTAFNKKLFEICSLLPELDNLIRYIQLANTTDISLSGLDVVKVSSSMKKYYPELSDVIVKFNENYRQIRKKFVNIKRETDKIISGNLRVINDYLSLLGIQYSFNKDTIDDGNKNATFYIKHNSLKEKQECVENLSFGEKNIIGLVLFLIAHKNVKFLIVDDPASSYDEYRRKVIFNMLFKLKRDTSTILVLSHDHVFAKFAVYHLYASYKNRSNPSKLEQMYKNHIGNIDYVETFKTVKIKPIESNDFNSISEFIKQRLNELPQKINYQVVLNLRLFYEINKATSYHKDVYGYLSSILHAYDKDKIDESLRNKNRTEEEILDVIEKDLGLKYSKLDTNYKDEISEKGLCDFEKIIYARECCVNSEQGRVVKEELSNIVHMNLAYAICLNPYKYNYFSRFVYNYVAEELNFDFEL